MSKKWWEDNPKLSQLAEEMAKSRRTYVMWMTAINTILFCVVIALWVLKD